MKNQKGITLVALIITIIVMLILAGVSISLVVGDNGVLTQAQNLDPIQERATLREAVAFANTDITADYYTDTTDYKTKYQADYGIVSISSATASESGLALDLEKLFAGIEFNRSSKKYGILVTNTDDSEITAPTAVSFVDSTNKKSLTSKSFKLYLIDDATGVNFVGDKDDDHRVVEDADGNEMVVEVTVNITVSGDMTVITDDDKPTKPITLEAR